MQELEVVFKEQAQIVDPVTEHRQALHPHAEREAGVSLRVDADEAEYTRVYHAAAHDLQPAALFADPAASSPADDTLDVDLGGWFGEREIGRAEADLNVLLEKQTQEFVKHALELGETDPLIDQEPLHLVKHGGMRKVGIAPVHTSGRDDAQGSAATFHYPHLHRRRVRAQHLLFTLGYEIGWVIVVGAAVGGISLLYAGHDLLAGRLPALPSVWVICLSLAAMIALPPLGTVVLNRWRPPFLARLLGSDTVSLPPIPVTMGCMLLLVLSFLANGLGLALLGEGMLGTGLDRLVLIVGVFAIAWLAGFVVPGAPGGLGVREAILVAGLSPVYGEPTALALTVASRLCFIVGDGLAFVLGLLAYRAAPPAVPQADAPS